MQLNKVGGSLHGSIAPVTYLCHPYLGNTHKETTNIDSKDACAINDEKKDESNQTQYLWIWIHAIGFDNTFNTLQSACQRQVTYSSEKSRNLLLDIKMYILEMHVSAFKKIKTKQPLCIIKLVLTIFLIIDPRLTNSLHGWKKFDFL